MKWRISGCEYEKIIYVNCGSINEYHTLAPRETIVHSGKVRAVEFGPRPKISVATFFTKFRVDANSYYLIDNNKKIYPEIWQLARTEHDSKKNDYLEWTAELIRRYWLPQWKLHLLKLCRNEERSFEWSVLKKWKITQHTQIIIAKYSQGKVWLFFLLLLNYFYLFIFYFSREKFIFSIVVNFFKVPGRSIKGILISTLLYIFYTLFFCS